MAQNSVFDLRRANGTSKLGSLKVRRIDRLPGPAPGACASLGCASGIDRAGVAAKVAQIAIQLQQILETEHVTKTQLANRMKTSRASLDRLLDAMNPSLTVASLGKAAAALGRKVELRFVPA